MSVKERILAIRLSEKINCRQEYVKGIGVTVEFKSEMIAKQTDVDKK